MLAASINQPRRSGISFGIGLLVVASVVTFAGLTSLASSHKLQCFSAAREILESSHKPSVCVVARSSPSHLPAELVAFLVSLGSSSYYPLFQFIIPCEFSEKDEIRLRSLVRWVRTKNTDVFVVNRERALTASYAVPNQTDWCYLETDLLIQKLLNASKMDLRNDEISWPAHHKHFSVNFDTPPLCDYFLVTNTDNLYGKSFLPTLHKDILASKVCACQPWNSFSPCPKDLIAVDFVSHYPKTLAQNGGRGFQRTSLCVLCTNL
jgi:hypothetical protein